MCHSQYISQLVAECLGFEYHVRQFSSFHVVLVVRRCPKVCVCVCVFLDGVCVLRTGRQQYSDEEGPGDVPLPTEDPS